MSHFVSTGSFPWLQGTIIARAGSTAQLSLQCEQWHGELFNHDPVIGQLGFWKLTHNTLLLLVIIEKADNHGVAPVLFSLRTKEIFARGTSRAWMVLMWLLHSLLLDAPVHRQQALHSATHPCNTQSHQLFKIPLCFLRLVFCAAMTIINISVSVKTLPVDP